MQAIQWIFDFVTKINPVVGVIGLLATIVTIPYFRKRPIGLIVLLCGIFMVALAWYYVSKQMPDQSGHERGSKDIGSSIKRGETTGVPLIPDTLKAELGDAAQRLSSANSFWTRTESNLSGGMLQQIRTDLGQANTDGQKCQNFSDASQPDPLRNCIAEFSHDLGILAEDQRATEMKSDLDASEMRLTSATSLLSHSEFSSDMLQPTIKAAMDQVNADDKNCKELYGKLQAEPLSERIKQLNQDIDVLSGYQVSAMKRKLDASVFRQSSASSFWVHIRSNTPSRTLRPELEAAINQTTIDSRNCVNLYNNLQPGPLADCIQQFTHDLDVLDSFK